VARAASGCTYWNHLCAYSFSLGSLQNIGLVMPKTRMCERIFVRKEDTTVYKPRCMLERNETSERIGVQVATGCSDLSQDLTVYVGFSSGS
jgi:hypothetical protein